MIDSYSPALCRFIYRTWQRQQLSQKMVDFRIVNIATQGTIEQMRDFVAQLQQVVRDLGSSDNNAKR